MTFMAQKQLGSETGHLQLHDRGRPTPAGRRSVTVPTWKFDSFVSNRSGAMRDYPSLHSSRPMPVGRARDAAQPTYVAWVKIDAEGFDPFVLYGAESSLRQRAIGGLMFEYSETWHLLNATHTLRNVVHWLDNLSYRSYFIGRTRLIALSHGHWDEAFESKQWSDIVAFAAGSPFERTFIEMWGGPVPCGLS